MFGSLRDFRQVTVTLGAQDQGKGQMIMGAGEQPRVILGCAAYSGTNTAASTLSLYVIPSQAPASAGEFDLELGGQDAIKVIQGCSTFNNAVNPSTAQGYVPSAMGDSGGRGSGPGYLILPPYALLVIAPSEADLNGTIICSVSSAELC